MTDWLQKYADANHVIIDTFRQFLLEEDAANAIGNFQKDVIPGLLQTPEYARAVMEEYQGIANVTTFPVQLRLERQERVRNRGIMPVFVVTPGALRRRIGTYATWRDQLLTIKSYPYLYCVTTAMADTLLDVDSFVLFDIGDVMSLWSCYGCATVKTDDSTLLESRNNLLDELIRAASETSVSDVIDGILKESSEY